MSKVFNKGIKILKYTEYEIKEEKGIPVIVPTEKAKPDPYNPLKFANNRPKNQEKDPQNYAPHIHAGNIDLSDEKDIIEFVNKWGLLQLWKVNKYKYIRLTELGFVNIPPEKENKGVFDGGRNYSIWFEFEEYKNKDLPYMKYYCEPLSLFVEVIEKYQKFIKKIGGIKNNLGNKFNVDFNLKKSNPIPYYNQKKEKWGFGWEYPSLYHGMYLFTYLDLVEGFEYRECAYERCNNIFIPTNPKTIYCSKKCRQNQNTMDSRKGEKTKEIEKKVKEYWEKGFTTDQIYKKIKNEFNKTWGKIKIRNLINKWKSKQHTDKGSNVMI